MELTLHRYNHCPDSTGGLLSVDGEFFCYTCEDQAQAGEKVMGETRIPAGRYEVVLRQAGGMHQRYQKRFGDYHDGMLWLLDVPGFEWVYIHVGNNDDHTSGCILVGERPNGANYPEAWVANSVDAYLRLYARVVGALHRGERVFISVQEL